MKKLSILLAAVFCAAMSFAAQTTLGTDWNTLFGTSYNGTFSLKENALSLKGTADDVTIAVVNGKSTNGYIKTSDFRAYSGYTITVSVPEDKNITALSSERGGKTYSTGIAADKGTLSIKNNAISWSGKEKTIKLTISGTVSFASITVTYEEEGAVSSPTFVTTETDFADTTTVTLAAEEGLDIYYTLDGTEPTVSTGTKYAAAIALNKTTTIKAIAYNATTQKSSAVAEKTYTCYNLITTCADLVKAADNDFVELGKVTVVYVNGGSTYICDKTGYGLIFKYNFGLKAGQEAEGIKGRVSIYNGLPEVVPSVDTTALTITEGKVPEPAELTVVPTAADLNKYVHITGVATPDSTWKSSDKTTEARTLEVAWGKDSLTLYNTFKIDQSFEAGCYNIVGFVTCYNTTIQIAVVSATAAVYSVVADVNNDDMGTIEGLPAEKIAYGTEITLTAKPNTGYEFVNWTDITGTVVSTEAAYTFMVTSDVNIQANFAIKTFKVDADVNDEKMGTVDGVPADEVAYGTEVTFTALPADGYKFVNWTDAAGAEVSTEAAYTFTVTAEVTYTANFALSTAIDNTTAEKTATKRIENGTLIIEKNGVRYNALGAVVE